MFKVGDKVRSKTTGEHGVVVAVPGQRELRGMIVVQFKGAHPDGLTMPAAGFEKVA